MNKIIKISMILSFIMLLFLAGCTEKIIDKPTLSELQITACNSAEEGGSCATKLESLNLVTQKECCEVLRKCC